MFTLHTLIWSTAELELQEPILERHKPPSDIPIWLALDQQNIYDLQASESRKLHNHTPSITSARIDELFQLVRDAQNDQLNSSEQKKSYSINSTWNFDKLPAPKSPIVPNDTNPHIDTPDSAATKETNIKLPLTFTTAAKTLNEHDKIQLRQFILYTLNKWKEEHHNNKTISLADIMHDALAQDEPE